MYGLQLSQHTAGQCQYLKHLVADSSHQLPLIPYGVTVVALVAMLMSSKQDLVFAGTVVKSH